MRGEWLAAVVAHVRRLEQRWDPSEALDPGMLTVARDLSRVLGDHDDDLTAWHALGMFYMQRVMARFSQDDSAGDDDREAASDAFARCFVAGLDVPESMRVSAAISAADTALDMLIPATESPEAGPVTVVARLWQRIIAAVPAGYPVRATYLRSLSVTLFQRFSRTRDPADLDAAVTIGQQALEAADDNDEDLPNILMHLADSLIGRFVLSGAATDLHTAIGSLQRVLRVLAGDSPDRAWCLSSLGNALSLRFEWSGDGTDLDAAVTISQQALEAAGEDDEELPGMLLRAGNILLMRFWYADCPADLDAAIAAYQQALNAFPAGDPSLAVGLSGLGNALHARYGRARGRADLDEAITLHRQAVATAADSDPNRAIYLSNLGAALLARTGHRGDQADAEEAAASLRQAVAESPAGYRGLGMCMSNLSSALRITFQLTGTIADLDEAVTLIRGAIQATTDRDPRMPTYLQNLVAALGERHARNGDIADLDEAIAAGGRMMDLVTDQHPNLAALLSSFGGALLAKCGATHQPEGLDLAIAVNRRAVAAVTGGHPDEAGIRTNLGLALEERFSQSSSHAALDEAIGVYRRAAETSGNGTTDGGKSLLGLGRALLARIGQVGAADGGELDHAVTALRQALAALPPGHVDQPMYQSEIGKALRLRFEAAGDPTDLDQAVALSQAAVEATPVGHPNLGSYRFNLAEALVAGDRHGRQGVSATAATPARSGLIAAMAAHIKQITSGDLSAALDPAALADARRLTGVLDAEDSADLHGWGIIGLFQWSRLLALPAGPDDEANDDANEAFAAAIHAYTPCFVADVYVPEQLRPLVAQAAMTGVALGLYQQALGTPDVGLLTHALELWRRILGTIDDDHPYRAPCLAIIGSTLATRYTGSGDRGDLDEGITCLRQALGIFRAGHPGLPECYADLGDALLKRFELVGDPTDLDQSIAASRRSVEASTDEPDQESFRTQLAMTLLARARLTGAEKDLDTGISMLSRTAGVIPSDDPGRPTFLSYLSDALLFRYRCNGRLADLDRAVSTAAEAMRSAPEGHPNFASCAYYLGNALLARSERTGNSADRDAGIDLFERGIEATAAWDPTRPPCLGSLCQALRIRFSTTGSRADLDAAIDAGRRAVEEAPDGSLSRAGLAGYLSAALLTRFVRSGSQADLDGAAAAGRTAVGAAKAWHPDTAMVLAGMGLVLRARFELTRDPQYLDESIAMTRHALGMTSGGHLHEVHYLTNLSVSLTARYQVTHDPGDLDEAIGLARRAARAAPDGDPTASFFLAELGIALHVRYALSRDEADLDEAADALGRAVAAATGAVRAENLMSLGAVCETRFERTGAAEDAVEAIARYTAAARAGLASPTIRITAARAGAGLAARRVPEDAAELLADAVRLLPLTASRQLTRTDQQHALSQFAFLASDAAALTLAAGQPDAAAQALGLLELGRAVLQGQALETRGDLTELHVSHPVLAARFLALRDQLDAPDDAADLASIEASLARGDAASALGKAPAAAGPDRHAIAEEFGALLDHIHGLEGFESFLLPPQASELTRQAAGGPIAVFNVSRYRSDALIVTAEAITLVPLPDLSFDALTDKITAFDEALKTAMRPDGNHVEWMRGEDTLSEVLEWLWDAAAAPVLHQLGHVAAHETGQPWRRIWWIPGGLLGLLPLHAAGYHRRGTGETVLDRVVSSYTPTVRALAHARDHAAEWAPRRTLIVAMPTTPGQLTLPSVMAEADMLRRRLPSPTMLIERPGTVDESTPTRDTVLALLPDADIAHFSCHGSSDPVDPSRSLLLLHDYREDPFTVASLIPVRLQRAQLAYLSACRTARNTAAHLLDEAIHLASAFQLAGYPHVVGTLWTIYDTIAVDVARAFYAGLETQRQALDVSQSAQALHHSVRDLRDNRNLASVPSQWAAYLHTGM